MTSRTKTLFHFTSTLDTLLRILREGFWPQYCLEDTRWLGDKSTDWLAWPMVSFCDIPISRLHEHTDFYGYYGIGLYRAHWAITGLNPVLYVSEESTLRHHLHQLILDTEHIASDKMKTAGMVMMAYCKPMRGRVHGAETKKEKDFYSECEWRFISSADSRHGEYKFFLSEEEFRDKQLLKKANEERRKDQMLEFRPEDVRYIAVKSTDEIHDVIHFIDKNLRHEQSVRDLLKTRIIALEELSSDI